MQADSGLPTEWEVRHSNSKNLPYYFNATTKESRWEPPSGTDTEKLKTFMAQHHSTANARQDTGGAEGKIRASHLLVKHKDSRRPSSWREAQITRSKEEALEILRGHEERIQSGSTTLGDLAVSESDCSSARKRGDLSVTLNSMYIIQDTDCVRADSSAVARCRRSSKRRRLLSNLGK